MSQDTTTVVLDYNKAPPLEGGNLMKIGGMWNLKYETSLSKFYEIHIKIEPKGDTYLDLKNIYNHINTSRNTETILKNDLITDYQSIKIHSKFEEYFVPDLSQPSYSWNAQT